MMPMIPFWEPGAKPLLGAASLTHQFDFETSVTPGNITIDARVLPGDLMIAYDYTLNNTTGVTPAGWTFLDEVISSNQRTAFLYKVATAGDAGSNLQLTPNLSGGATRKTISVFRPQAGAKIDKIEFMPATVAKGISANGQPAPPAVVVTPTRTGGFGIAFIGGYYAASTFDGQPPAWTQIATTSTTNRVFWKAWDIANLPATLTYHLAYPSNNVLKGWVGIFANVWVS